jgi:hypothetical protein
VYVGIDQSYSGFGITFLKAGGTHETIVKKFGPEKYGPGVTRLYDIRSWLEGEIDKRGNDEFEHVCMEGYAASSKFGREKAGELGATVKMALYESRDAFPTIVAPTSLKKFILGKGVGGKNEILLGCYKRWSVDFRDDNAADSYGLARIAEAIHTGKTEFAYEREVIAKLTPFTERPAS